MKRSLGMAVFLTLMVFGLGSQTIALAAPLEESPLASALTEELLTGAFDAFFDAGLIVTSGEAAGYTEGWASEIEASARQSAVEYLLALLPRYSFAANGQAELRTLEYSLFRLGDGSAIAVRAIESIPPAPGDRPGRTRALRDLGAAAARASLRAIHESSTGGLQ